MTTSPLWGGQGELASTAAGVIATATAWSTFASRLWPPAASMKQTGDQVHSPAWARRRIMCYGSRVAVLISLDVFRRLMGYLKPIQALFVFRVVSTRVINAAA